MEMRSDYAGHPWVIDGLPPSGSGGLISTWCTCNPAYTQITDPQYSARKMCSLCAAGKYKDVSGNMACSNCIAGKYSPGGLASCINCPSLSTSPASSTAETSCVCNSGYEKVGSNPFVCQPVSCPAGSTGPAGSCTLCAAGKYKALSGAAPCDDCVAGKYSAATGQISGTTCQNCAAGKFSAAAGASVCLNCAEGTYKAAGVNAACDACEAGKFSAATGQSSATTCQNCAAGKFSAAAGASVCLNCFAGTYKATAGVNAACDACVAGKFSAAVGAVLASTCSSCQVAKYSGAAAGVCTGCSVDQTSPAGSTSVAACVLCTSVPEMADLSGNAYGCNCKHGYSGPDYGPCTACPIGTFGTSCQECTYQMPFTTTAGIASATETACVCQAGYAGDVLSAPFCEACPVGTFKATISATQGGSVAEECMSCPAGTYNDITAGAVCKNCTAYSTSDAGSTSAASCQCLLGYTKVGGLCTVTGCPAGYTGTPGSCQACAAGTAKGSVGSSACATCIAGKFSAASGLSVCSNCSVGTYGAGPGALGCEICAPNTFSDVWAATACKPCPAYSTSLANAGELLQCQCEDGFEQSLDFSTCAECTPGYYDNTTDRHECSACGGGLFSEAYRAKSEETCVPCGAGNWSKAGMATCSVCPQHSNSPAQSDAISDCICDAGATGPDGGTCLKCAAATYKVAAGSAPCDSCPTNAVSEPGSKALASCECEAGYTGADGGECTACAAGEYKTEKGSAACSQCAAGEYSADTARTSSCDECDAGKYAAAAAASACTECEGGKYADATGATECQACVAGKYKAVAGPNTACDNCEAGTYAAAGINLECESCAAGKYAGAAGAAECSDCASGTSALAGATECGGCAPDTWAGGGAETCTACPEHSSSPGSSTAQEACACDAGHEGDNGAACVPCEAGEYKASSGAGACQECPAGQLSAQPGSAGCSTCPDNERPSGGTVCLCDAGYSRLGGYTAACQDDLSWRSLTGSSCLDYTSNMLCAEGTYGPAWNVDFGTFADWGTDGIDASHACCECGSNWNSPGASCSLCPVATFKEQAGDVAADSEACVVFDGCCRCRPNSTTLQEGAVHASACLCIPGYGGAACLPCVTGSYKSNTSMAECEACAWGATTVSLRSTAAGDCVAARGHFGNTSVGFAACANGSYAQTTGMALCAPCPPGSTSPPGADELEKCECVLEGWLPGNASFCSCQPGYARDGGGLCQRCVAGAFCPGGDLPAQPCPAHSSSPAGAAGAGACECEAGHSGAHGGPCSACAPGQWKQGSGSAACSNCSAHSHSLAASAEAAACLCVPGYTGEDGGPCAACGVAQYKPSNGSGACSNCSAHATTLSLASTSAWHCLCGAGFGNASANQTGFTDQIAVESGFIQNDAFRCEPCAPGLFKPSAGAGECPDRCPGFSSSPAGSTALTDCACEAGYTGVAADDACAACAVGTHKSATGSGACVACAANATTRGVGSTGAGNCSCVLGFSTSLWFSTTPTPGPDAYGAEGIITCTECPANHFGAVLGLGCWPCPANTHSRPGAPDAGECHCVPGFEAAQEASLGVPGELVLEEWQRVLLDSMLLTTCAACPVGWWKAGAGDECALCPEHSTTAAEGAASIDACECVPGRYMANATAHGCASCPADTFKHWLGNAACTGCPGNASAPPGSNASSACRCRPGFAGEDGGTCAPCGAARYKEAAGSADCSVCPPNTTSPAASTALSACQCLPGFVGPLPCRLCPHDTFALNGTCANCPLHSQSLPGAPDRAACRCRLGFHGPHGGPCAPCPHGTFRGPGNETCHPCGEHRNTTSQASSSAAACLCVPGHVAAGGLCVPCPNNTHQASLGGESCAPCTPNAVSPRASTSAAACTCVPEFWSAGDGTCDRVCAAGFEAGGGDDGEAACFGCAPSSYKPTRGDGECQPCPLFSFTLLPNRTAVTDCMCEQGHLWNASTQLCDSCPPGEFNNEANSTQCYKCWTECNVTAT